MMAGGGQKSKTEEKPGVGVMSHMLSASEAQASNDS